jgi:hypothetical protein
MSASMTAFSGFRKLMRAGKLTFKNDAFALKAANESLKEEFLKNKYVTDKDKLGKMKSNDMTSRKCLLILFFLLIFMTYRRVI